MSDKVRDLYKEVILKHNSDPKNFIRNTDTGYCIEAYNPICGDQYNIYFNLKNTTVTNLSFHGYGCAISKSSISIMTELLNNKSLTEAIETSRLFKSTLIGTETHDLPQSLMAFLPVREHPGRMKCVTLGWDALTESLNSAKQP